MRAGFTVLLCYLRTSLSLDPLPRGGSRLVPDLFCFSVLSLSVWGLSLGIGPREICVIAWAFAM